jgi:hypothetical protein
LTVFARKIRKKDRKNGKKKRSKRTQRWMREAQKCIAIIHSIGLTFITKPDLSSSS